MMLTNLNIYYSAACNLQCSYCCMPPQSMSNDTIVNSLRNGSFTQIVNNLITKDTISLGLWGMEPTINAIEFQNFILPILKQNPQIKYIFIPTNMTSTTLMEYMLAPLNRYTQKYKHKLIILIQASIDGPKEIHDGHINGNNTYDIVRHRLNSITKLVSQWNNKYIRIKIFNKSTLTAQDLYTDPDDWWYNMAHLQSELETYESYNIKIKMDNPPTIAVPGNYTKEDGEALVKWGLQFDTQHYITCAAGLTSKTVDCLGRVWDCHMLYNKDIDEQSIRKDFDSTVDRLLKEGEIIETNKDALWNAISSIYCWATGNNSIPESYIKLLGNGALQEV